MKTTAQGVGMLPNGKLVFDGGGGARPFIFCGICDSHFMMCECRDQGYGKNFIWKGLPNPAPHSSVQQNLQRWASLVPTSPSMSAFDAQAWLEHEGPDVVAAFAVKSQDLIYMMEDYCKQLSNDPATLSVVASAAGGDPLVQGNDVEEQVNVVSREGRAAVRIFLQGDWTCVTRLGIVLIQNAFQTSDPTEYPLDNPQLIIIFQKAVACLWKVLEIGMNDYGWRLAMECDRKPQTYTPKEQTLWKCGHCQQMGAKMTCSRCKTIQYCNKECQTQHWKDPRIGYNHKKACKSKVGTATERDYLLAWCAKQNNV